MKVPLWKPSSPELEGISQGELTKKFEEKFAQFLGVRFAVAVSSGTAAIYLALKAFDIDESNTVLVPDLTAIGTINAVSLSGATPMLTDVKDRGCLDLDEVYVDCDAVIAVHFNGRMVSGDLTQHEIVIEDACQALGSRVGSEYAGTIGDCGCFSFSPTKTIYTGQGGIVVTNHYWLYEKVKSLRDQGRVGKTEHYIHKSGNFKFTDLQAKIALKQLSGLRSWFEFKNGVYDSYYEKLGYENIIGRAKGEVIWFPDVYTPDRDKLYEHLLKNGVSTRKFYLPLHIQKPYSVKENFLQSEVISNRGLWLPSNVGGEEINYICGKIKEFLG